ncbi:MAG: 60S ribosomal protein L22 [Candidatus Bathyarchaeia archaeon]|jgi:hypothetical protein|nr:hypothetical protein [Candidatus Bathyarchaeota archaeon A05DMB-4]MDH7594586.1 60S ribosomal protein L22 [Candidatus Bathyarchaeota archaeon]
MSLEGASKSMEKIAVDIMELRNKSGNEAVEDLVKFLEEKLGVKVDVSGDKLLLSSSEGKGMKEFSRSYLRVLLRKFLHKTELKEDFRVIAGANGSLIVKGKKIVEVEE